MKKTPLWLAAQAAFAVSLLGCAPSKSVHGLKVNQLIASQERFLGREVTVEGYLRFSSNARNLWHSRKSSETEPYEECVSVGWSKSNLNQLMSFDGKTVRVTGKLIHRPFGEGEVNLWYCSDWYIATERVTLISAN